MATLKLNKGEPQDRMAAMESISEQNDGPIAGGVVGNDTKRLERMEEIAAQTESDHLFGDLTDDKEPETETEETAADETAETEPVKTEETETAVEPVEDMVTLTIDGAQVQVPRKDIEAAGIRYMQKDRTADQRLQEATELLTKAQQFRTPQPSTDAVSAHEAELVRAIQVGEPEEAANALRALQQQSRVTPEELSLVVDARMSFSKGVEWLQNEASDVWNDARMRRQLVYEEQELRKNGDARPHLTIYKELVNDLRKWRGVSGKSFEEKREQKSQTVAEVPKANATQNLAKDDEDDDTQSTITALKKSRGQA